MLERIADELFSRDVVFEATGDFNSTDPLTALESQLVSKAVAKRVAEFRAGRHCARRALRLLGVTQFDLLSGPQREPLWPPGIVGSITHCTSMAAAVAARASQLASVGIDVETAEGLKPQIASVIATEDELSTIANLSAAMPWDKLIFSAKESFYKAWFPLTRQWLEFHDVAITFIPTHHRFEVKVRNATHDWLDNLSGRYIVQNDLVWTSVCISADR